MKKLFLIKFFEGFDYHICDSLSKKRIVVDSFISEIPDNELLDIYYTNFTDIYYITKDVWCNCLIGENIPLTREYLEIVYDAIDIFNSGEMEISEFVSFFDKDLHQKHMELQEFAEKRKKGISRILFQNFFFKYYFSKIIFQ